MKAAFWTNTIWYIGLAVAGAAVFSAALVWSKERKKTFAFFFAALGMTYFIEVVLLLVTDAYAYYPQIASDSFHESLIGNFFSQYSVTASAVLIATLGLNTWWRIGFSAAYFLIDVLFVKLSIYTHHWYSSWYTLAGFFVYSWVIKKWHGKIFAGPSKPVYLFTLFLGVFSLGGNILGTTLNFLEIRRFAMSLYTQATKDNTASSIVYSVPVTAAIILLNRLECRFVIKCFAMLLLLCCDYALYRAGVIQVRAGWFVAGAVFTLFGRYFFAWFVGRCLGAPNPARKLPK